MTRLKKAKKRPAVYPNVRVTVAALRLLRHMYKGGGIDTFKGEPDLPWDSKDLLRGTIHTLKQVGRGDIDARVAFGQAPGRGGNRKSKTRPLDIAEEYDRGRQLGLKVADRCSVVRAKFKIRIKNATIIKIASAERASVRERQEYARDFDRFDS